MEIAFFFLLTNHADSELNNYDSYDLLTQRIVSKSFSPGSGAVPRVRPLNLLLAEQDPFSAISSSPLSFIIMHSTLSNESVQATHKPNIKVSPRNLNCAYLISGSGPTMHSQPLLLFLEPDTVRATWPA